MKNQVAQAASWLWRFVRQHRAGLLISLGVCIFSVVFYAYLYLGSHPSPQLIFLYDLELKTLDLRFQIRGKRPPTSPIAIVTIDQKSQDVLGHWPFPRSQFAKVLDVLKKAGAKVVAFDVTFPQPDENSSLQTVRELRKEFGPGAGAGGEDSRLASRLKSLEADADNDQKFADAIGRFENAILGYILLFEKEEIQSANKKRVDEFVNLLSFQAYPQIFHPEYGDKFNCKGCIALGVEPNLEKLAMGAKNYGFFNVVSDSDGIVRREPLVVRFQDSFYPSLDVATALAYSGQSLTDVGVFFNINGLERIDLPNLKVPTDPDGYLQIDFHGPANTYPWYSMADVVQEKLPNGEKLETAFRDRIVLIGPTATGIGDLRPTPFETLNFPGVEVHANCIDNLLTGRFIRRGNWEFAIDIGFILLFSLAVGVLLSVVPAARATIVIAILLGLFWFLAYYLFAAHQIWIATFLPTATLAFNYVGIVSYRFFFEEREKKKVRTAFGQYLAPGVVNLLLKEPELLRLGGDEKVLTAMFTDIRGFTAISEGLTPSELVELLNEYLSEMSDIVIRNWGTLDKYIGDAIMAFWGAPYPQPDHAERACRSGLEMLEKLKTLQERWQAQGRSQINIGIGINTGPMVVGNMGSNVRFNFTIMGDNVNLASRLEGINKKFGTHLIISESTFQAVGNTLVVRELDLIRVQGKMKPVRIYELLGLEADRPKFRDLVDRFHEGLESYRSGRWDSATEIFDKLAQDYPDDRPSRVFLERCEQLMGQPPEGVWDGVFTMTEK